MHKKIPDDGKQPDFGCRKKVLQVWVRRVLMQDAPAQNQFRHQTVPFFRTVYDYTDAYIRYERKIDATCFLSCIQIIVLCLTLPIDEDQRYRMNFLCELVGIVNRMV